jgi:hypothetical protein
VTGKRVQPSPGHNRLSSLLPACYLPAGAGAGFAAGVAEEVAVAEVSAFLACFFVCFLTGVVVAVESFAVGAGVAELLLAGVWAKVKAAAANISMSVFMAFFRSSFIGARFHSCPC